MNSGFQSFCTALLHHQALILSDMIEAFEIQ